MMLIVIVVVSRSICSFAVLKNITDSIPIGNREGGGRMKIEKMLTAEKNHNNRTPKTEIPKRNYAKNKALK